MTLAGRERRDSRRGMERRAPGAYDCVDTGFPTSSCCWVRIARLATTRWSLSPSRKPTTSRAGSSGGAERIRHRVTHTGSDSTTSTPRCRRRCRTPCGRMVAQWYLGPGRNPDYGRGPPRAPHPIKQGHPRRARSAVRCRPRCARQLVPERRRHARRSGATARFRRTAAGQLANPAQHHPRSTPG